MPFPVFFLPFTHEDISLRLTKAALTVYFINKLKADC